jgi:hypothetical protein
MKTFKTVLILPLIAMLLMAAPVGATSTYDSAKSVARNQVDALIALANAAIYPLTNVLFVDGDRTDTYTADGSLAAPYKTIAAAKAASVSGDVLVVAPGAYSETVTLTTGTTLFGWNVTGTTLTGNYLLLNGGNINASTSAIVLNEDSADIDFRVESNDVSDALMVDAGLNTISHGTWDTYDYIKTTDQSYSLTSTGRAGNVIQTVGEAATLHLMTALLTSPGAGAVITIKTGGSNDVTIDTQGAETIDGANTYALDGTYEAVTLTNDGSNWFILGGYLE